MIRDCHNLCYHCYVVFTVLKSHARSIRGHLLIWMAWLTMQVALMISAGEDINGRVILQLLMHSLELAVLIYVNLWLLIPAFLDRRRYFSYVILVTGFLALVTFGSIHVDMGVTHSRDFGIHFVGAGFYLLIGTLIGLYARTITRNRQLHEQRLTTEIELLKAQVNPHFFFNTLNSIYSLSLTHPHHTSTAILQLAEIMKYLFETSRATAAKIDREIAYIEAFLNLQQLRFGERCEITLKLSGSFQDVTIPPVLLLPLVENAFKHGPEVVPDTSFVRIHLSVQKKELFFQVSNSTAQHPEPKSSTGTGLDNLRRRLNWLYGDQFDLELRREQLIFTAMLRLPLN